MEIPILTKSDISFFTENGYLVVAALLSKEEVYYYEEIYRRFLDNSIDSSKYRSDLSGSSDTVERITQIMVPSKIFPSLLNGSLHNKTLNIAKQLLGSDMVLDFDMLINKEPYTDTETPWHQDAAYWIDMPDGRAVSCWVAIDRSTKENGCMWYLPKSHNQPLRPHVQIGRKGALRCEGSEEGAVCVELEPGSCVLHHGGTLHYSRGNSTGNQRRAIITNFRPISMVELERGQGVDHTGERKVNNG